MFYARPTIMPHTHQIHLGLPLNCASRLSLNILMYLIQFMVDVLHRLASLGPVDTAPPSVGDMENSRHLAKYIFPRQYGLSSPFTSTYGSKSILDNRGFHDRNEEIKVRLPPFSIVGKSAYLCKTLGPGKTPKRLKELLPVIEKLIWRHGKCKYRLLLDATCPSKV
jgi:hypothetical protein